MSKVWVQSVSPNNLHGFRASQIGLNDLVDELNLIYASNASGKSTLAKAMVGLFQPNALDLGATVNGVLWDGSEFQSLSKRKKENVFPGFPGRSQDYYLDLPSLLEGLGKDSGVEQILGGGYGFPEPVKATRVENSREVKAATAALQRLRDVRKAKQALLSEEERLPQLEQRYEESRDARKNSECLEVLVRQIEWSTQLRGARTEIEEIERLNPGLTSQRPSAAGDLKLAQREISGIREALEKLGRELARSGGVSAPLKSLQGADEERLRNLVDLVKKTRALIESEETKVKEAESKARMALKQALALSPTEELDELAEVTAAQFEKLSTLATVADRNREKAVRNSAFEQALKDFPLISAQESELTEAQRRLLEWLNWSPTEPETNWFPLAVVGAVSAVCAFLPWLPVRVVGVLAGIGVAAWLLLKSKAPLSQLRPSLQVQGAFGVTNPNPESVAAKLNEIALTRSQLQVRKTLEVLKGSSEAADREVENLIALSGLKCDNPYSLAIVASTVENYLDAKNNLALLKEGIAQRREALAEAVQRLGSIYEEFGFSFEPGFESESAEDFKAWHGRHDQRAELNHQLQSSEAILAKLLDDQGIPLFSDSSERADVLLRRVDLVTRLAELNRTVRDLEERISGQTLDRERAERCLGVETLPELTEIDLSDVKARIQEQDLVSREFDERNQAWQDLRSSIKRAEQENSIADAEASYRTALAQVETRFEDSCRDSIRSRVSEAIRERLMTEELPPLLQGANENLARFSHGRYRIEFGREPDEQMGILTVSDEIQDRKQKFRQLSTGTKVHVLLALRLALIEEQEAASSGGTLKFPLIADEPMAVSDPESSEAIGEALLQISKSRQVILFTSQESDVAVMRRLDPSLSPLGITARPAEVPTFEPQKLERTKLAPLAHEFDPRYPIGAHSMRAIFGDSSADPELRIDQTSLSPDRKKQVANLETLRKELNREFQRLLWSECSDQPWASTGFSDNLRQFVDDVKGCPHRFQILVEQSRSKSFNRNNVEAATGWLSENGYVTPPPEMQAIADQLARLLKGAKEEEVSEWVTMYGKAYVPGWEDAGWALPAAKGKTAKRPEPVASGISLFEEI